ncbi:nuclear transport factor 2 family protein [Bradyrhizobium hipponense]|uniref:Nuclear transport factor 2 family protein n=1 Tax=Bradyrhizobium hipponense TaxID=2605638 RepID=A0A5S4YUC5_9BRAD|nr:nuclear transport factor 2 family protein [Bradyrhizobium hipponense]TYO67107.1 nuclear transport factor 2 family protein [Bradyrhizobium hipponense]
MTGLPHLHPAAAASLEKWHAMIARKNLGDLPSITHPDVVFRLPTAFNPYHGIEALVLTMSNVVQIFEDFSYHRQAATADGRNVVLEFSAKLAGKMAKGIDFIRFDDDGRIVELEVMMRPLSGAQALATEMAKRLSRALPASSEVR